MLDEPGRIFEDSVSESLLNAIWCFGGCYAVGRVLRKDQWLRFLQILLGLWTVGIVAHSLISVYAAWTGRLVWTIGGGGYWGLAGTLGGGDYHLLLYNAEHITGDIRLYTPVYATIGGGLLSVSTVIILCAALICRRKAAKILYILASLPVFLAMCLTDARTGHIMTGVGIGMIVFAAILRAFITRDRPRSDRAKERRRTVGAWAVAIAGMLATIVVLTFAAGKTISLFNRIRASSVRSAGLITAARAEAPAEGTEGQEDEVITVSNRGYSGGDILTNRPKTWANVIRYIRRNPITLLTGASIFYPMNGPNAQPETAFAAGHSHCMPLQLVLVSGIPGLLLMLGFFIHIAVCAIRTVSSSELPLWPRLLPAPIVMIIAGEMVECLTRLTYPWPLLPLMMIFCGIISAMGSRGGKPLPAQRTDLRQEN